MALKSTLSLTLALLTVGTLALGVQACSGGGDDDDDAATTPPSTANICIILWAKPSGEASRFDVYTWQAAASQVDQGAGTYNFGGTALNSTIGFLYYRASAQLTSAQVFGITTSGNWNISVVEGLNPADQLSWADTDNQNFFDASGAAALGAQVASNGTGAWTGDLSSIDPDDAPTPGTGTITVAVANTANLTIGSINYAQCFEANLFASMTPEQFSRYAGAQMLQRHLAR